MNSMPLQEAAHSIATSVLSMHQAGLAVVAPTIQQAFQNRGPDTVEDMLQDLTSNINVFQKGVEALSRLDETSSAFQILQGLMWRNDGNTTVTTMVSRTMAPMLFLLSTTYAL